MNGGFSMSGADVIVIGAGTVGASIAYELALAGASVRLLESGTRPAAGCSRANAGLLAPSHSEPLTGTGNIRTGLREMLRSDSAFHIRPRPGLLPWLARFAAASSPARVHAATRRLRDLGLASLRRHSDYHSGGIETSFQQKGMLDVFGSAEARDRAVASLKRNPLDLDYELLDEAAVRSAVPGIASAAGGIFFANEAHCDSRVFVEAITAAAEELGVEVSLGTRVLSLEHSNGRIHGVRTRDGVITADHVVIAAGYASDQLTRPLRIRQPLAPAKGYVIDLETRPGDPCQPVGLKEAMVVATPYPDRLRLAGTLELVGPDTRIDAGRSAAVRSAADRALPMLAERRTLSVWAGLRPCSADGLPIIGSPEAVSGLTFATGHGQQGLVLAPGTARLVADHLTGTGESSVRPGGVFHPDRFKTLPWRR